MEATPTCESADQSTKQKLLDLLGRAQRGDHSAVPELRALLDCSPDLWEAYGNLAGHAEASLIQLIAGSNLVIAESLLRKLGSMKDEFGRESAPPLERLLIDRVTATWLQVNYYDARLAQKPAGNESAFKLILTQQDAAHRRHLSALKTLATVKKLLKPTPSPLDIASRLEGSNPAMQRSRAGLAESVPVCN